MMHTSKSRRDTSQSTGRTIVFGFVGVLLLGACGDTTGDAASDTSKPSSTASPTLNRSSGSVMVVRDTHIVRSIEAAGIAEPMRGATLSTKLMGTVTSVLVNEGDVVRANQPLLRIDARDLTAKAQQVQASIADAEAMQAEAARHEERMRLLFADSAATRAQYEAAATGLARANAGVRTAKAAATELEAVAAYATVVAPFDGVVISRHADPGTFATPGAPLLTVHDALQLRVRSTVGADAIRRLKRGQTIDAVIDGTTASARIEGIVPAGAGNLYTVNAVVQNRAAQIRSGSAAILRLPTDSARVILVPLAAIVTEGDLTGVIVRHAAGDETRWVKLGERSGADVEVSSGLSVGDSIVVRAITAKPGA